ncbi:MAG: hypothetical protein WA655_01965 [Candidatus Korobacteraceae bacterium]
MKLQIRIERLVLDGLPVTGSRGAQVQAAVQAELANMLGNGGLSHELRSGGALPILPAAQITFARGDAPAEIGRRIARAIHGSIGVPSRPSRRRSASRRNVRETSARSPRGLAR